MLLAQRANAEDAFALAAQLYQSGQWQQAVEAFDRATTSADQIEPTPLTSQLYAAECLVQLGQYAEAQQRYLQILQQNPPADTVARAKFRLGEAAWLSGDKQRAEALLLAYTNQYPLDASVHYAQKYLSEIRERKSSVENFAILDEAVGWERDGRHDAALAAYHELLNQRIGGPVRSETLRRAALLHARLAQSREALDLYGKYLVENPRSKRTAEVLLAIAWLHEGLDQSAQAVERFRQVCEKFPQSAQAADAAYWLAMQRVDRADSSAAAQYVDWLLANESLPVERNELWAGVLCLQCQLLADQASWKQIDELVKATEQQLPAGPLQTKLAFWVAEAKFRQREYNDARKRFAALETKTIGIDEPWTGMVPLRRAQLAARRQQWSEVLKILDQLDERFPQFELEYEVDYLRGRALAGRGEMTAARKFYRRVLESQEAKDTEAATMAGWMTGETFFHQKDYSRARQAYQEVMDYTKLPEWQARAALQAGKCWELEQRWDQAAKLYTAARERWPESASDKQLESRLRWAQKQFTQK